jgi:hypothetical protein
MDREYLPVPIDTSSVELPADLIALTELLAENAHEVWARGRIAEGWRPGPHRDDVQKTHPCLVPYGELTETEKEYDRRAAMETLRTIVALGYTIALKRDGGAVAKGLSREGSSASPTRSA